MIKEIGKYIENNTSLVLGDDLIVGHYLPDTQEDCVSLLETQGGTSNFYLPDYKEFHLQALSRGTTYFTARDFAYLIYDLLQGTQGFDLPVVTTGKLYYVNTITASNLPQSLGPAENNLFEISANYIFRIQDQ